MAHLSSLSRIHYRNNYRLSRGIDRIMSKDTSRLKRFGEKQGSLRVTIPPQIWKETGWKDGDLVLFETQIDGSVKISKL